MITFVHKNLYYSVHRSWHLPLCYSLYLQDISLNLTTSRYILIHSPIHTYFLDVMYSVQVFLFVFAIFYVQRFTLPTHLVLHPTVCINALHIAYCFNETLEEILW